MSCGDPTGGECLLVESADRRGLSIAFGLRACSAVCDQARLRARCPLGSCTALRAVRPRILAAQVQRRLSFVSVRCFVVNVVFCFHIAFRKAAGELMTIRIVKGTMGNTVIRLMGRIQSEDLKDLLDAMKQTGPRTVLDVSEVTIVDIDVVRFLRDREAEGIALMRCSRYIREWINRERKAD